jgi:hypothetical protein
MHNLFRIFSAPPGFFLGVRFFYKLFPLEIIFFQVFSCFLAKINHDNLKNDNHTTRVYVQNSQISIPLFEQHIRRTKTS